MNNFFKIFIIFLSINTYAGNLFNDNNNELISNDFNVFLINFEKYQSKNISKIEPLIQIVWVAQLVERRASS